MMLKKWHFLVKIRILWKWRKTTQWIIKDLGNKISISVVYEYVQSFQIIISDNIFKYLPYISIEGPVEIDETFIGAKQRSTNGRIPKNHHTVFGKKLFKNFTNFL